MKGSTIPAISLPSLSTAETSAGKDRANLRRDNRWRPRVRSEVQTGEPPRGNRDGNVRNPLQGLPGLRHRHRSVVGQPRVLAAGWRDAVGYPPVEIGEGGTQQRTVVQSVKAVPAPVAVDRIGIGEREGPQAVLGAREYVNSNIVGRFQVGLSIQGSVGQRAVAGPILGRRISVHHLGKGSMGLEAGQEAIGQSGLRVGLLAVAERE